MNSGDLMRALRGPVTLVTVGTLFAIDHMTPVKFDQTWPVLLIVFGLMSLAGRAAAPAAPGQPGTMPPGGRP